MANDTDRSITAEQFVTTVAQAARIGVHRIDAGEARDLANEPPDEIAPWLATTTPAERLDIDEFLHRVAERESVDIETAERHIEAVLETLAMRIAGGEVDDLRARLPVQFHPALDRGKELSGGKTKRMRLDDVVRRVAEQKGISLARALEHVSAVLRAVREAVGEQEFLDVTSQLPAEYEALVRR
jgi:uncharacterized protein (DUF2267 family)